MAAGFPGNPSCPSGRPDHPPTAFVGSSEATADMSIHRILAQVQARRRRTQPSGCSAFVPRTAKRSRGARSRRCCTKWKLPCKRRRPQPPVRPSEQQLPVVSVAATASFEERLEEWRTVQKVAAARGGKKTSATAVTTRARVVCATSRFS
eukprot:1184005-Prorocentrum_minimum.AAC.2